MKEQEDSYREYQEAKDTIEGIMDIFELAEVLTMLEEIWHDRPLAKAWEKTGKRIGNLKIEV
jgi:hypothetical protein